MSRSLNSSHLTTKLKKFHLKLKKNKRKKKTRKRNRRSKKSLLPLKSSRLKTY